MCGNVGVHTGTVTPSWRQVRCVLQFGLPKPVCSNCPTQTKLETRAFLHLYFLTCISERTFFFVVWLLIWVIFWGKKCCLAISRFLALEVLYSGYFVLFCFIFILFHGTSVLTQVMLSCCTLSYTISRRVWKDQVDHFIFKT